MVGRGCLSVSNSCSNVSHEAGHALDACVLMQPAQLSSREHGCDRLG